MTTKDILNQMEKEFDEKFWHEEALETHQPCEYLLNNEDGKCNCQIKDIKKFIHSYTRTLLESFGEEIINKLEEEINVVLDSEVVKNGNATRECIDGTFTYSRLKVKEILQNIT